ncbi:MAG: hypothetical protein H0W72_08885 [Planctomycetes bacterium]|nr:hypothetical protein [Planctomycetota bacterium]
MHSPAMMALAELFAENGHDWETRAALVETLTGRLSVSARAADLLLADLVVGGWLAEATMCSQRNERMVVESAYLANATLRAWATAQVPAAVLPATSLSLKSRR